MEYQEWFNGVSAPNLAFVGGRNTGKTTLLSQLLTQGSPHGSDMNIADTIFVQLPILATGEPKTTQAEIVLSIFLQTVALCHTKVQGLYEFVASKRLKEHISETFDLNVSQPVWEVLVEIFSNTLTTIPSIEFRTLMSAISAASTHRRLSRSLTGERSNSEIHLIVLEFFLEASWYMLAQTKKEQIYLIMDGLESFESGIAENCLRLAGRRVHLSRGQGMLRILISSRPEVFISRNRVNDVFLVIDKESETRGEEKDGLKDDS